MGLSVRMRRNRTFWMFVIVSVVIACLSDFAPRHTMPYDYSAIVSRSVPFASVWAMLIVVSAFLFRKRALWLLLGAPIALYWPIWLLINGYPSCWYAGNCA
jgi:hypothetical protein